DTRIQTPKYDRKGEGPTPHALRGKAFMKIPGHATTVCTNPAATHLQREFRTSRDQCLDANRGTRFHVIPLISE
ncbi:Hypothetical predicted protein, partial [Pelobates cultripes]